MKPLIYSLTLALIAGGSAVAQVDVGAQVDGAAQAQPTAGAEAAAEVEAGADVQTDAAERVGNVADQAAETTGDVANEVQDATEEVRETADETAQEARETTREATDEVQDATEEAADEIPAAPMLDGEAPKGTPAIEEEVRETQNELDETVPETNRRMRNRNNANANARGNLNAQGINSDINARGNINQLGLWLDGAATNGIVIGRTAPNGPAARFGLQPGDRIVSFNNQRYTNQATFRDALRNWTPNGPVPIVYERNGQRFTRTMPVTAWNVDQNRPYSESVPQTYSNESYSDNVQPQPYTAARPIYDDGYGQTQGYAQPCAAQTWSAPVYNDPCCDSFGYDNGWDRRAARQHRRLMRRGY